MNKNRWLQIEFAGLLVLLWLVNGFAHAWHALAKLF